MARSIAVAFGLAATLTLTGLGPAVATAAPTEQRVRIEGRSATLFEGPISTDGHTIKAATDTKSRRCDATNNAAHPTPSATPTAAADDAMRLTGQNFDGNWTSGFDDYFITRFGPDGQTEEDYAYWGIVVNGIYTSVGGCQYGLKPGDQTLWIYDAFNSRPILRLDGPAGFGEATANVEGGPSTAPVQQRYDVGLDQPFAVSVIQNKPTGDVGSAGNRGPVAGVSVAPVQTDARGLQTVVRASPETKVTAADGRATLSWNAPGWKRIKADGDGFVRSNRLDVCVHDAAGNDCGPLPADAQVRTAPPVTLPSPDRGTPSGSGSGSLIEGGSGKPLPTVKLGDTTISGLRITTDGNPAALVGVRWTIGGSPLKAWKIESRLKGKKGARWSKAASGTTQTSALLDLTAGKTLQLRITLTAASGASTTRTLGDVVVPIDDRLRQVRFGGRWARDRDPLAWRLTTTRMRKGATLTTKLDAGRPTLVVRADRKTARIEVRSGSGKAQRLTVRGYKDGRTLLVSGRAAKKAGTVRVKVLSGTVHVDGVAVRP